MSQVVVYPISSGDDGFGSPSSSFYPSYPWIEIGYSFSRRTAFVRFPNVEIPSGAVVESAILKVKADGNYLAGVVVQIYGNNVGNAIAPTTYSELSSLVKTTSYKEWTTPIFVKDEYYEVDIKDPVQEVLSGGSWASGNALQIIIDNTLTSYKLTEFYSVEGGAPCSLTITYSIPNLMSLDGTLGGVSGEFNTDTLVRASLGATLGGISGEILLENPPPFEDIKLRLDLAKEDFEDIDISFELARSYWNNIITEFSVCRAGSYDFEDISVLLEVFLGEVLEDIPVLFSVILEPQSVSTYVMCKLYCVCSEYGTAGSTLLLQGWNVSPNKTWYVDVTDGFVTLYDTEADMLAGTNPIATGEADEYSLEVQLTYVDEYEGDFEYYYPDLEVHLMLSEINSGTRQFRVHPITDLSEIQDPIYNNSNIILSKAQAELDLHTYMILAKELELGTHLPEIEPGDIVGVTSTRRSQTSNKSQILSQTISGRISDKGEASLTNSLRVASYLELTR